VINRFSKILMLAVATLWLLAPLHFALEEHRWCQEHSDFEHGESSDLLIAPPSTAHEASWKTSARTDGDDHHQCLVICLLEKTPSLHDAQTVVSADLTASRDSTRSGSIAVPSVPPVALAPKTSPPSA
jgi:hypothetical protein